MTKNCYKISLILLFLFDFTNSFAVQDSLFLYTRSSCSYCHTAKQMLSEAGIVYIERSLDNDKYGPEMLHKLNEAGFHNRIHLPVIFLNNQLLHPVYKTDKGLISVPLQSVVDSIINKYRRGELNLAVDNVTNTAGTNDKSQLSSDCEVKVPTIYLVCNSYNTEKEAKSEMNKLISDGYSFAGIIFYQNQYRVFGKFYSSKTLADNDLIQLKKNFQNAYLFEMP